MRKLFIVFLTLLLIQCSTPTRVTDYWSTIQKKSSSSKAMVVSGHPIASKAGIDIMKKGGNAVDASIAVQLALAVVYPRAGNIAGGGFMVYRSTAGIIDALDYREKAPAKASRDMYLDENGNPTKLSLEGHLASGVPGTVDGLIEANKKYGKLPFEKLIEPAIILAEKGFLITQNEADRLNAGKAVFSKYNDHSAFIKSTLWKQGDLLVQPELAWTLKLIQEHGREGFYGGPVGSRGGKGSLHKPHHWTKLRDFVERFIPAPSAMGAQDDQELENDVKRINHAAKTQVQQRTADPEPRHHQVIKEIVAEGNADAHVLRRVMRAMH